MKVREAIAILFCWILTVLLFYEIRQPDTFILEKSYTVSQNGDGTDYSLETFAQVLGPHPNTTYYFHGDFTDPITVNVDGEKGKPVTISGGNFIDIRGVRF
jgi:hypothetical protein